MVISMNQLVTVEISTMCTVCDLLLPCNVGHIASAFFMRTFKYIAHNRSFKVKWNVLSQWPTTEESNLYPDPQLWCQNFAFLSIFHGNFPGHINILHLKSMIFTKHLSCMIICKMKHFLNWSVSASYHGNSFKTPGKGHFTYVFSLLSNRQPFFG